MTDFYLSCDPLVWAEGPGNVLPSGFEKEAPTSRSGKETPDHGQILHMYMELCHTISKCIEAYEEEVLRLSQIKLVNYNQILNQAGDQNCIATFHMFSLNI